MTNIYAYTADYVDWHLHPLSGPGIGAGEHYYLGNLTGFYSGPFSFTVTFKPMSGSYTTGCCWPSGDEWVEYEEIYYVDNLFWAEWDFAPGSDPIQFSINVSAIPEPATWAMMIIGFGAVGSMVRTSRRRNALSAS